MAMAVEVGFFGGSGVGYVFLEQDFASDPMEFRFEPPLPNAFAVLKRVFERVEASIGFAAFCFRLSKLGPDQSAEQADLLFSELSDACAHLH